MIGLLLTAVLIALLLSQAVSAGSMDGIQRPFTGAENAFNLGPTGARLWATYVAATPGMEGSFDFIHKVNIPSLYAVGLLRNDADVSLAPVSHKWYPSYLNTVYEGGGLAVTEDKFITWDDCAVDVVSVTNLSQSEAQVSLRVAYGGPSDGKSSGPDWSFGSRGATVYVRTAVRGRQSLSLAPGESVGLVAACALALSPEDADGILRRWMEPADPLETQKSEYARHFDGVPEFRCSDAAFERMWDYRWYLVRRNLADPRHGSLAYPLFYEGRSAKMALDPWKPRGWEFSKLIPFSTPFHLLEGRWHADPSACKGEVSNLVKNQADDGLFRCAYTDRVGGDYTDFTAWGAWQLYLVHPDKDWLSQVGPGLVRQVDGTVQVYDKDGDLLPEVTNHNRTGKEYQPSFFYKGNYPRRPAKDDATPLERVDAACYLYMNACAASNIMAEIGNKREAARLGGIAEKVRQAILDKMWDPERKFFYDIDAAAHDRIPVENVVGFDPFLAGIAGSAHLPIFERLSDPEQFWTKAPVPSTTKKCPAYAPDASWKGEHVRGEHGCMWNGPTWPFTNSTVLMALADATLANQHKLDSLFAELLRRYTRMCFRNANLSDPMIYEHYNPETGRPISREEDYYHSSWIDLIVRYVAGVTPLPAGRIEFRPIDCGFESFSLHGIHVASREVDVDYDTRSGYTAKIDGVAVERRRNIRER